MTKNRPNLTRQPGGNPLFPYEQGNAQKRFKKVREAARSLLSDRAVNEVVVLINPGTRRSEKVVISRDTPLVNREVTPAYPVKVRLIFTLRTMLKQQRISHFSEVRTVQAGEVAFHEVDVYIARASWLDDGDLAITTELLELQADEEYITPRVYPDQAERVV